MAATPAAKPPNTRKATSTKMFGTMAQPIEPVVGVPAQVLPGERKAVQMQHVQIRGSRIPRLGGAIGHDATSWEQESPPRPGYALHRHRQNVMGKNCGSGCQDQLAPMRCGFRLNVAVAAPRPWDAVQASLPQPRPDIMTVSIRFAGVCRKSAD